MIMRKQHFIDSFNCYLLQASCISTGSRALLSKKESNKKEGKMEYKYGINKYRINCLKYKY